LEESDKIELGAIVWKTLFNEEQERLPDPNKPENTARINAEMKAKARRFKAFVEGPGKPFFEEIQNNIRWGMYSMLIADSIQCGCPFCYTRNKLQWQTKLLAKAFNVIKE